MSRPAHHPGRPLLPLLPLLAAVLVVFAAAGPVSAISGVYPVESLGNRGAEVRALQSLLRVHGRVVMIDGVFGASTQAAVAAHQGARGLPVTGVVNEATWRSLTPKLVVGDTGYAVHALQRLLNEKRRSGLTVDNVYGATTRQAIASFQRHMKATVNGETDWATWRRLLWHFEQPVWGAATGLCDYSVGNGAANWGTGSAIGQLEAAAKRVADAGYGRVPVGDAGFEHGGDIPGHQSHEQGMDIDLRPMRDANNQCTWGGSYRLSTYDRTATRALVKAIRATAPRHVKLIYFNDPVLIRDGLTTWYTGHDDHLHVRYCNAGHPLSAYRCTAAPLPAAAIAAAADPGPPPADAAATRAEAVAVVSAISDTVARLGRVVRRSLVE